MLKNNKTFTCDKDSTIFEAAKKSNIVLEHSCLSSRCRSCVVKVLSGKTMNNEDELVLTEEDKNANFVLSCNAKPLSDIELDIEDLGDITLFEKKIIPSKINIFKDRSDPRSYRLDSTKIIKAGFKPKKKIRNAINELSEKYSNGILKQEANFHSLKWLKEIIKKN